MSESKFKAPKEVLDELDELRQVDYDTLEALLADIYDSSVCADWIMTESPSSIKVEQAVIDYVIWNQPTIKLARELEREPHYVIKRDHEGDNSTSVFYKCEHGLGIGNEVFGEEMVRYEDGWTNEKANQLNEFVKGKLVEVK